MMGGTHIPPQDPQYAKVESARRAELLRQGKSTDGAAGVLVDLLMGALTFLYSGLARLWQKREGFTRVIPTPTLHQTTS